VRQPRAFEPFAQREHTVAQPAVVVATDGVARDARAIGEVAGRTAVVDGERDRRLHAGAPRLRREDAFAVVGEVPHLAVATGLEPPQEVRAVLAGIGGAEANEIEADVVRDRADRRRRDRRHLSSPPGASTRTSGSPSTRISRTKISLPSAG
jgi:hypothetical protein